MQSVPRPRRETFAKARTHGYAVSRFSKSCVDSHWHYHPEFEIIFIEQGRGARTIGRSVQPYADGDLCLMGADLPHRFGSHPRDRLGARWTVIHFQPDRFGEAYWNLPQNRRLRGLLDASRRGVHFAHTRPPEIAGAIRRITGAPSADFGTIHLLEFLAHLAARRDRRLLNATDASASRDPMDLRLSEFLAWVDKRAEDPELSQSEAAARLRLSPQAFCRFFRQRLGKTFRQYVNELRVAWACSRLQHSDAAVTEIAFRSGFNNLANFNRRFREIVRCTPSEYRSGRG